MKAIDLCGIDCATDGTFVYRLIDGDVEYVHQADVKALIDRLDGYGESIVRDQIM